VRIGEEAVTTYRQLPKFWHKTAGTYEHHSRKTLLVKYFGIPRSGPRNAIVRAGSRCPMLAWVMVPALVRTKANVTCGVSA
jgi:hypothetical protein